MRQNAKRLEALETRTKAATGVWHRIIQEAGQTQDQALDAYGRDKIGPDDNVIIRRIIEGGPRGNEATH